MKNENTLQLNKLTPLSVTVNKKNVSINLPPEVADFLKISGDNEIIYQAINGTIILMSSENPAMTIPPMSLLEESFAKQKSA